MRERLSHDHMPETFFSRHAGCVRPTRFDRYEGAAQTKVIRPDTAQAVGIAGKRGEHNGRQD
jgi:hypothetical protein